MENPMERFTQERDAFEEAKANYFKVVEQGGSHEQKLAALIALAEAIGDNEENSRNFEEDVLRGVQFKDGELYTAYEESLKKLAA